MSKPAIYKVGRRLWEWRLTPSGKTARSRRRVPGTNRDWLKWREVHNEKTLQRERLLADKLPLWWAIGLVGILVITPFLPNTMISVVSIFCIYASITNVDSFIPEDWFLQRPGLLLGFVGTFILLLGSLLVWRLVNSERLGLLLRVSKATREDEAFAEAIGIDFRCARLLVFIISSAALGVVGAFYAMYFRSISPQIFSLDQMLLLFAMMVIGGLGRAEGAVVGTAIVTVIDKGLIELGQPRIVLVALCMIFITIFAGEGIIGAQAQFHDFRKRKQGEARAQRSVKGGEAMPEEAAEIVDKQELYYRRFNKRLRDRLKLLITPELIEEHRTNPLGHHSDSLARVLNYFRRGEMIDKYVIHRLKPAEERFRIMAVSGERGSPPRIADDREYTEINEAYHAVFLLRVNDLMEG